MQSFIDSIQKRCSVRTFSSSEVEGSKRQQIEEFFNTNRKGPFGNEVRFQIIEVDDDSKSQLKELGTYGVINGARLFIAGAVRKGYGAMEDYGYCMEKNILRATALGLGTVWLGGFFKRSAFAAKIGVSGKEVVPAVTPVGYAADHRSMMDHLIRFTARSKKRKDFGELFFCGDFQTPLTDDMSGRYFMALESLRLAPSASNRQPWRILKDKNRNVFHFYLKENMKYNNIFEGIQLQNIDMGIAMCHFELAAGELGLVGRWTENMPSLDSAGLKYIISWVSDEAA